MTLVDFDCVKSILGSIGFKILSSFGIVLACSWGDILSSELSLSFEEENMLIEGDRLLVPIKADFEPEVGLIKEKLSGADDEILKQFPIGDLWLDIICSRRNFSSDRRTVNLWISESISSREYERGGELVICPFVSECSALTGTGRCTKKLI